MEPFKTLEGVAAPLNMINVDTDMIIPKQYLKTIQRTGLGKALFDEMRFNPDGSEKPDFVLNKPAYRKAVILVAGDNFGCGSSREHAPWAIDQYGFRAILAPSYADIFFNNCFKNGLLPIVLPERVIDHLFAQVTGFVGFELTIDLASQVVLSPDGESYPFEVQAFRKHCLINGLDDIGLTLTHSQKIRDFEAHRLTTQPWLAHTLAT